MQQKIVFTAGMDTDNAPESDQMQVPGKAFERFNVRVLASDNGENGTIETMLGNTLVSRILPTGDNLIIGSCEDQKTQKVYYFLYNNNDNHQIIEYDYQAGTTTLVLQQVFGESFLAFNPNYLITGINIVELDEDNHLLYWTDNLNEPKKLNIEKAKYYSAGNYTLGYSFPFEARFITRIKQPCPTSPSFITGNDATQKINYLFQKLFQFKIQYVYDDNEISSWSPISRYAFPITTDTTSTGNNYKTQDNALTLFFETGSSIVTRIRIAARQVGTTDFLLIADLSKINLNIPDNSTQWYNFYNNGNYVQLEATESNKLFDLVPLRSKSQEIIEGQRIIDGLITENFDPVKIDMRLPLSIVALNPPTNQFFVDQSYLKSGGIYKYGIVYYDEWGNRSGLSNFTPGKTTALTNDTYGNTLYVPFLTDPLYAAPHATPNLDMGYVPQVDVEIYNAPPSWAKNYQITRSKNEAMGRYIQFVAQSVRYTDNLANDVAPASATYCIIYLGNITGAFVTENPGSQLVYDYATGDRIRFIANTDWATIPGSPWTMPYNAPYYSPVQNTVIDSFFSFNDSEIAEWNAGTQVVSVSINPSAPTIPLDLLPGCLFEIYQPAEQVLNDNELVYEIAEEGTIGLDIHGNRIHEATTDQIIVNELSVTYAAPNYTCVVATGHGITAGDKVKLVQSNFSTYGVVGSTGGTTIVIDSTGFTSVGSLSAGVGKIYRAAEFTLTSGDCFRRMCYMPMLLDQYGGYYASQTSYIESSSASDFFSSEAADYGRPNTIDPEIKQIVRPSSLYYSELFLPETSINGLSTVYDTNFQTYEQRYGGIYKLVSKNIGLIMMQELKLSLVPVSRIIYGDLSLQNTVGASTVVLNPQSIPYQGEIGIGKNPESHAQFNNADYGIDVNRGICWRLSNDGITAISEIGSMHNFFTDKCKQILVSGIQVPIYGVFDIKFNEYIISFNETIRQGRETITIPGVTLAWNEKANQWSTFYDYNPENMCSANTGIITFKDGALWNHNVNTSYNNFYGANEYAEFWVYCNANPSNVKILTAISEETNGAWEVYSITTPNGQETNLVVADFEEKENNQYASVLRDINTPDTVNPILEGDVIRDRTFLVKFRYLGTDYNKINAVNFYYIASNLSNRN